MLFRLPDVPGRFEVGATTFALPLNNPQDIGSAKLRKAGSNTSRESALRLEEIVFTAFYPADLSSPNANDVPPEKQKKAMDWMPKPVHATIRGYAHFARLPYWSTNMFMGLAAPRLKLPAYPNTPLLDPTSCSEDIEAQWPLVFFCHGLSGTRTTYSHICIRLASQGKVVLAMEHHDGTAPAVISHFAPVEGRSQDTKEWKPKVKYYLHPEDVIYDNKDEQQSKSDFRIDQLLFRRLEVYLAFRGFADFVNVRPHKQDETSPLGEVFIVYGAKAHPLPKHGAFWKSWTAGRVNCKSNVSLIGHSFGGAFVFSVLSQPPPPIPGPHAPDQPNTVFEALPITHALVLDPWLEPLPTPGPAPLLEATRDARAPQILILNSETFTLWHDHFARLEGVVHEWRKEIVQTNLQNQPETHHPINAQTRDADLTSPDPRTDGGTEPDANPAHATDTRQPPAATPVKLLTLVRGKHVSFSDFSVIWPMGHVAPSGRRILRVIGDLALAFLGNELDGALRQFEKREKQVERVRKGALNTIPPGLRHRRLAGKAGDVIVH